MDFVAGIDGGGTKTLLLCKDLEGRVLLSRRFKAFNLNSIGRDAFAAMMCDIADTLNGLGNCRYLCIGAAGVSNKQMCSIVGEVLKRKKLNDYLLVGDHVIALEGALEGAPGLAVIAGTGSICFGKDSNGNIERTGGWGHLIGDEGSAYALGRDAFKECAKAMDGYGRRTMLAELLQDRFGLSSRSDIIEYVYSGDKTRIADVSIIVDIAYLAGDEVAHEIVSRNAEALSDAVLGVAKKLELTVADVALLGGLIDKDTPFRTEFVAVLEKRNTYLRCIDPKLSAVEGAVLLAEKAFLNGHMN